MEMTDFKETAFAVRIEYGCFTIVYSKTQVNTAQIPQEISFLYFNTAF